MWVDGNLDKLCPIPYMNKRDKNVFSEARYLKDKPVEFFWGATTDVNGPFPYMVLDIVRAIDKELGNKIAESSLCSEDKPLRGLPTELFSISGYNPTNGLGFTAINNKDDVNMKQSNPRVERLMDYLTDLMFNDLPLKATSIVLQEHSQSGFPDFEFGSAYKQEALLNVANNIEKIFSDFEKKDFHKLAQDHKIVFAIKTGRRLQSDSNKIENLYGNINIKSKDRYVYDRNNKLFLQNKSINNLPWIYRKKPRQVNSYSSPLNFVLQLYFAPSRPAYLKAYPTTFHSVSGPQITETMNNSGKTYCIAVDAKSFDKGHSEWLVEGWINRLDVHPTFKEILKVAFRAPFICADDGSKSVPDLMSLGDVTNPYLDMFARFYGLPSGIACVSDLGKFSGILTYLYCLEICFKRILSFDEIKVLLEGKHPEFATLNCGDDALYLFKYEEDYLKFMDFLQKRGSEGIFVMQIESPGQFLGNIVALVNGKWVAWPNINSYVNNYLNPERDVHSRLRKRPDIGWSCSDEFYASHPCYEFYKYIRTKAMIDRFDININEVLLKIRNENTNFFDDKNKDINILLQSGELTPLDMEVLIKPDLIHYKIDIYDLSPKVRNFLFSQVPYNSYAKATSIISSRKVIDDRKEEDVLIVNKKTNLFNPVVNVRTNIVKQRKEIKNGL